MDINSKTLTIFKSFVDDLIKVFPEYKEPIIVNYSDIISLETLNINENTKIKDFLSKIDVISNGITDKDESIFKEDLFLLNEINFKEIWESNISDKTKDNIWKYLQSFCLINININTLNKLNEDTDSDSKRKISKKNKRDIENFNKINEDYKNNSGNVDASDINDFNNILENTNIGKIAQEISEELNINDENADISEILNPESMMKIFGSINEKMMNNSEMSKEGLQGEAMNICSSMKDNPLFSQLMGMQSNLFSQMMPQGNQNQNQDVRNINVNDRNAKARKNARKKLDNRKKNINVKKSD